MLYEGTMYVTEEVESIGTILLCVPIILLEIVVFCQSVDVWVMPKCILLYLQYIDILYY